MHKTNLTVGAFSIPFAEGFAEKDGQVVPKLKSLKRFAAILSNYGPFNLKFILPEEGQMGVLSETGYHDGVLGLLQEGKADMCFSLLPLDIQKAPGYFSAVISEDRFYIFSTRDLHPEDSAVVSSLTSITVIPLLLAILAILILEFTVVKHFKLEALVTAIFRSFGITFHQHFYNRSAWLCLVQMFILMFPVFIFSAAFRTQTIVGTADYKIDTLRDVIDQGKIPFFLEGISLHDFFKAKVTKDYADNYERAVTEGLEKPFPLGRLPEFERKELMITFVSGVGKKLAPLMTSVSGFTDINREGYYSAKPFHKSLQAILFSFNASENIRKRFDTIASRDFQSGIVQKMEGDIYIDFMLSFYPTTLFEFHKSEF
uniref:Solute-binding protein family 3/N-terminal domain-containing protein n=1 Tax=Tetranychus urticae TaxID=32264 RepID=T1KME7_TETUR